MTKKGRKQSWNNPRKQARIAKDKRAYQLTMEGYNPVQIADMMGESARNVYIRLERLRKEFPAPSADSARNRLELLYEEARSKGDLRLATDIATKLLDHSVKYDNPDDVKEQIKQMPNISINLLGDKENND